MSRSQSQIVTGLMLALVGCSSASVRPIAAVQQREGADAAKVVVLLRCNATMAGRTYSLTQPVFSLKPYAGFRVHDAGGREIFNAARGVVAPSRRAMKQGWAYLLLAPGDYFLVTETTSSLFTIPARATRADVVYVGSLRKDLSSFWAVDGHVPTGLKAIALDDEADLARGVAAEMGFDAGHFTSEFATAPDVLAAGALSRLAPWAVAGGGNDDLRAPDWHKRAVNQYLGLGGAGRGLGGSGPPAGEIGILLGYLVYLPFGAAMGDAAGKKDDRKWQPCVDGIAAELKASDLPTKLSDALVAQIAPVAIGRRVSTETLDDPAPLRGAGYGGLLRAEVRRVELRECAPTAVYCVEVAVRVRLRDAATGRLLYARTLLYGNPKRLNSPFVPAHDPRHEHLVTPTSRARPIEQYCHDAGRELFRDEIDKAVSAIARQVAAELSAREATWRHEWGKPPLKE